MKQWTKRLLSSFVALMMLLSLLPAAAFASEGTGNVAKIGDVEYATLDEAVEAAEEGATIVLLQDCDTQWTSAKQIKKSLTFTGDYTITMDTYGFGLAAGKTLCFDGCNVLLQNVSYSHNGDGQLNWGAIILSSNAALELDNGAEMKIVGGNQESNTTAIYASANSRIDISGNSTLTLDNCKGGGIQWDGATCYLNVTENSSYIVQNGCYSGMAGTAEITVTDSTMSVTDCTGNGSNGSNYKISNSKVTFAENGSHGISASGLTVTNGSTVISDKNGMYGIYVSNNFYVDDTSTLTVTGNSSKGDFAGLKLTSGVTDGKVEDGAVVTIMGNYCSGLSNNGKVVFEEGVDLTIMNNNNDKGNTSNGGGVYNSGASASLTLPSDAAIYNNHAVTAGDDIYNTGTITFGKVGSNWVLDDCDHFIDGWYQDNAGARWDADGAKEHVVSAEAGTYSVLTALKAAHSDPVDKTTYPTMDKSVQTGTDEEGNPIWGDATTSAAGEKVNFKLESNVPQDLKNYLEPDVDEPSVLADNAVAAEDLGKYSMTIHDVMDPMLTNPENFVVMIGDKELTSLDDYTIAYDVSHEDNTVCDFEITLDLVDLYEKGAITDADIENATPIVVTYTATLSDDATAGNYVNTAWVTYPEGETEEDTVTVKVYRLSIFKYDQSTNAGLAGAKFELYQKDAEGNVIEDSVVELTSGEDGYVTFDGLDEGTYYLKETQAPDGYVCSDQELPITIPSQADTENVVHVQFANSPIPHTGGMGTTVYTVGGAAILAMAGVLFVATRKKEQ